MCEFDLLSDLHLEFHNILPPEKTHAWKESHIIRAKEFLLRNKQSRVLVIAGDISNYPAVTKMALDIVCQEYAEVIWTDGNHEHYGNSRDETTVDDKIKDFRNFSNTLDNLIYLNDEDYLVINDTAFVGCNGWYDFRSCELIPTLTQKKEWENHSNDFQYIDFGGFDPSSYAYVQFTQLKNTIQKLNKNSDINNIVVTTHTVPIRSALYGPTHSWYKLNGSYQNTWFEHSIIADIELRKKIKVWCFGHTHTPFDRTIFDIRFVNNACGYSGEIKTRKPKYEGTMKINMDGSI